jgi:hypothetical protein
MSEWRQYPHPADSSFRSSTQTSSAPDGVPNRGNKDSARRARQRAEEQLTPDHFCGIALSVLDDFITCANLQCFSLAPT